jgi:DNA (cytosine-5)-methyltransferase 1
LARVGRVAELFAGVGGFRLGLEGSPDHEHPWQMRWPGSGRRRWHVTWSNQWEPASARVQHASACYEDRFSGRGHLNRDFVAAVKDMKKGRLDLPTVDLVVGGFPCQDYSVAKTLGRAVGLAGDKGALWWAIRDFVRLTEPRLVLLENVDRLLKSPAGARGRDFAVILDSLQKLGYQVEWRVVNAASYGYPQRRRRVFLAAQVEGVARRTGANEYVISDGALARALPIEPGEETPEEFDLRRFIRSQRDPEERSPFKNAGMASGGIVWTQTMEPSPHAEVPLGAVLQEHDEVESSFFIARADLDAWRGLKAGKSIQRQHRHSETPYFYSEGAMLFPDPADRPARTILTGEGGVSPSRFKHVIKAGPRKYRRLTPLELERLNGFPDGWTETGMSDSRRAFVMGNALVVGLVHRIGIQMHRDLMAMSKPRAVPLSAAG